MNKIMKIHSFIPFCFQTMSRKTRQEARSVLEYVSTSSPKSDTLIERKRIGMTSSFAFCLMASLGVQQAQGMENHSDFPENSKTSCLMALASYGDGHEESKAARFSLEHSGFTCESHKDDSALGMQLWTHTDERKPIIAIRGTDPSSFENLLADLAVIKYGVTSKEPYNYIREFAIEKATYWKTNNFIGTNIDPLLAHLPSDSAVQELKIKGGTFLGGLGGGFLASFALTPLGAALVAGASTYATSHVLNYPEARAINALVTTSRDALTIANKWADQYDHPVTLTGHSLGGLLANTVAELVQKPPEAVLTFNAPGGVERLITEQKKYILGEQDDMVTWVKKSFVVVEEKFPHDFRRNTKNIARENGIVACFGGDDASRTSIFIKDYYDEKKCPMGVIEYLMENHAIVNLAKNFGGL